MEKEGRNWVLEDGGGVGGSGKEEQRASCEQGI